MEVTNNDINRIYDAISANSKVLGELSVSVATLSTQLEDRPRPCFEHVQLRKDVDAHLENHLDTQRTVKRAILRKAIDLIILALTGALFFWLGERK